MQKKHFKSLGSINGCCQIIGVICCGTRMARMMLLLFLNLYYNSLSVCRCSQTAGRNSCSIVSGDISVCIVWQTILSRVRVSARPSIFYIRKTLKTSGKPGRQCHCLFQWPSTSYCHQRSGPSRLAGTDPPNSDTATAVCVWGVCARVRAGACAVCACVRSWVMCLQYTIIIFDPGWYW